MKTDIVVEQQNFKLDSWSGSGNYNLKSSAFEIFESKPEIRKLYKYFLRITNKIMYQ